VLLQVTGDILSLTTDIGAPVLPGFGPTVFAERANAATGLAAATAVAGLGRAGRAGSSGAAGGGRSAAAAGGGGGSMPQAVVDFLMPPQAINADIVSQVRHKPQGWDDATLPQHCCSSNVMNAYLYTTAGATVQPLRRARSADSHARICAAVSRIAFATYQLWLLQLYHATVHAAVTPCMPAIYPTRSLWLQ
jgi:hypothetical protein